MRVSLRRPPTVAERLLGRRHAKAIRRRLGFLALGVGASLLKPRATWTPSAATVAVVLAVIVGVSTQAL
jgi:hypothetical protein